LPAGLFLFKIGGLHFFAEHVTVLSMFAVIETGGKQYKVKKGDIIRVEKLPLPEGDKKFARLNLVNFKNVLLLSDGNDLKIGTPFVAGASVEGKLKIVFRYHSKTRYRKFKTHRQHFTEVEIAKIG